MDFAAVREQIFQRRSKGGRPGFEGADRKKIPLTPQDWEIAEQVASPIAEPGFRPSAGQVAGVLLSLALNSTSGAMEDRLKRRVKARLGQPGVGVGRAAGLASLTRMARASLRSYRVP